MAAKSLQASVGNIVGQLKGSGGGRGGKGIGLFGIFAAIAIAVGALLVPKIKEAVKFLYRQANNIFKFIQGTIRTIYQGVQEFVSSVREWINSVNGGIASINDKVKAIFTFIGQGDNAPQIPEIPTIKENLLPDLKFLEEGYSLDNLLGDTVAGAGNILGGMFGGAKDMFQGMLVVCLAHQNQHHLHLLQNLVLALRVVHHRLQVMLYLKQENSSLRKKVLGRCLTMM